MRTSKTKVEGFESIEVYDDLNTFLNLDFDVAIVTTPTHNHFEMTKTVLEKGKNVIVEKPFAVTSEEAKTLYELSKKLGRFLSVFQNRVFDGDFMTVQKILKEGKLGRVVEFQSHFELYQNNPNDWRFKDHPGSGNLYDLGAHLIHQAYVLFGKPKSIFAILKNLRKFSSSVDDYFTLILDYESGVVVTLKGTMVSQIPIRYIIHGTEGSYIKYDNDPQVTQITSGMKITDKEFGNRENNHGTLATQKSKENVETLNGNYGLYFENFAEAYSKNDPSALKVPTEEVIAVMELIEAAQKSSKTNSVVFL